jgi:hypothetical protein
MPRDITKIGDVELAFRYRNAREVFESNLKYSFQLTEDLKLYYDEFRTLENEMTRRNQAAPCLTVT